MDLKHDCLFANAVSCDVTSGLNRTMPSVCVCILYRGLMNLPTENKLMFK